MIRHNSFKNTLTHPPSGYLRPGKVIFHPAGSYYLEQLQGVWPKITPVAMEMPIFDVNFSSLNYPNLNDESLGPYG